MRVENLSRRGKVREKTVLFFLLAIFFFLSSPTLAQPVTSGADFLKIDSSARSAGMGSAFTAVADDVNALTWNPAGLAQAPEPQLGYLYMLYIADISYNFGGVVYPFQDGANRMALGAAVLNLGTPSFDSTLGAQPSVSAGDYAFQTSFAYQIRDQIAFGISAKYILEQIAGYNAGAVAADLGILFKPFPRFRIGAGLFNLGSSVVFNSVLDALPTTGRLGVSYQLIAQPQHSLLLSVEGDYDLNESLLSGSAGGEYCFNHLFAVRAGYTGNSYQQNYTLGLGIDLKLLQLDYAYAPVDMLGDSHRFSLTLRLGQGEPPPPQAPADFKSTSMEDKVELSWKASPSASAVGYNLYLKRPGQDHYTAITHKPVKDLETIIRGVHADGLYGFALSAVDSEGRESPRVYTTATTSAAPTVSGLASPTGFKVSLEGNRVKLDWDDEPSAAGFNLYLADDQGAKGLKISAQPLTKHPVFSKSSLGGKTYRFFLTAVGPDGTESATVMAEIQIPVSRGE